MSNVTLKSGCVVRFNVDVDILDNIELVKEDFLSDMRKKLLDASERVCAKYAGKEESSLVDSIIPEKEKPILLKRIEEYLRSDNEKPMCFLIARKTKTNGEYSIWTNTKEFKEMFCEEKSLIFFGDSVDEVIENMNR